MIYLGLPLFLCKSLVERFSADTATILVLPRPQLQWMRAHQCQLWKKQCYLGWLMLAWRSGHDPTTRRSFWSFPCLKQSSTQTLRLDFLGFKTPTNGLAHDFHWYLILSEDVRNCSWVTTPHHRIEHTSFQLKGMPLTTCIPSLTHWKAAWWWNMCNTAFTTATGNAGHDHVRCKRGPRWYLS